MDSNTEKNEIVAIESSSSTIAAPPPSPTSASSNNNSQQHSESESPIHVVKVSAVDASGTVDKLMNEISKNTETFNEIESELVQLNLTAGSENDSQTSSPDTLEDAIRKQTVTTCIKESIKMDVDNDDDAMMDDVPLNNDIKGDVEEEPDTLSPLLSDIHTHIKHSEMLVNGHYYTPIHDNEMSTQQLATRTSTCLNPLARSFMRPSPEQTGQDSSCSDSDLSLSFDRKIIDNNFNNDANNCSSDECNNNKEDSGCDVTKSNAQNQTSEENEGPIEIPDDETCVKIVEQVEFYFSDESLLKDAFLLKHVRRNKEGFVSLKLVSSFKRVRQICKDWRAVGVAIQKFSKKIELNDINTKIRRLEPLPDYDETLPSRTIVATGLPYEKLTIEKVSDIFSKCGEIALVRILRPGGQIPADVRQFMNKHPELLENECALVEFNESASARIAQQMEGIYVLELVLPKKKTGKKANVTKLVENLKYSSESDNERNRGGEITPNRFHLKRNNSAFYIKPEQNTYIPPPRRMSFGNDTNNAFEHFQNKRFQNMMQQQQPMMQDNPIRRYSTCSDAYSSCHDNSRRSSLCSSELSRRFSNCSQDQPQQYHQQAQQQQQPLRRYSNCSDFCSCSRRGSQTSDMGFRRISQTSMGSDINRKISAGSSYSTGSGSFQERRFSNASDLRRVSVDSMNGYERKISGGSMGSGFEPHSPRKYSNGFDPFRKLSNTDQYYMNGRRISTDSGYDRRMSFGSDVSGVQSQIVPQSPVMGRPRSGSFLNNENVVRTPIGPDGSKGFVRARRFGQVIPPVN
uniref:CSON010591 protein n=1 Tax=Culicoides sonorensis TaxID=179676 RepID=A0A336KJ62_CULSO